MTRAGTESGGVCEQCRRVAQLHIKHDDSYRRHDKAHRFVRMLCHDCLIKSVRSDIDSTRGEVRK